MSHQIENTEESLADGLDLDLLKDLERQSVEQIRKLRAHERLEIKIGVVLEPGNASAADDLKLRGVTGDLSEGGCQVIFSKPVGVGDIFRLRFERGKVDIPVVYARCLRCRLVREDHFEAGFSFFNPIKIGSAAPETGEDLLA